MPETHTQRRVWVLLVLLLAAGVFAWSRRQQNAPESGMAPAPASIQSPQLKSEPNQGGAAMRDLPARKADSNRPGTAPGQSQASSIKQAEIKDAPALRPQARVARRGENSTVRTIEAGVLTLRALKQAGYSQEQADEIVNRGLRESLAKQYRGQGRPVPKIETVGGGIIIREVRP